MPRYRMLRREELIEKLSDGDGDGKPAKSEKPRGDRPPRRERQPRDAAAPAPRALAAAASARERPARKEPARGLARGGARRRARGPGRAAEAARSGQGARRRCGRGLVPPQTQTSPPSLRSQEQGPARSGPAAAAARPPGAGLRREPRRLHLAAARDRRRAGRRLRGPRPDRPADRSQPRGAGRLEARGTRRRAGRRRPGAPRRRRARPGRPPRRGRRRRDPPGRLADPARRRRDGQRGLRRRPEPTGQGSLTVVAALERQQ